MTEIKLDFDTKGYPNFERIYAVMGMCFITLDRVRVTRSTHSGWHVVLHTRPALKDWEIVALQALCGSDWKRETFNYIRVHAMNECQTWNKEIWEKNWNVLFEANSRPGRNKVPRRGRKH